jgi:ubiquinone/menaquinone biosynthesis C-methylase UbiE
MPSPSRADWQLPSGVSRAVWDYVHDPDVAREYDAGLATSSLFSADLAFAEHWLQPPGRLIDLGCGTGRLMLAMARCGHHVIGVDLSAEMLSVAREKCAAAEVAVDCVQANLVELDGFRDQVFDHAACLFSTLGMIDGAVSRTAALRQVFSLLKPGGRFVLHVHNRWFSLWDGNGRRWLLKELWRQLSRHPSAGDRPMPVHHGIVGLALHHFTRREAVTLLCDQGFRISAVQPVSLRPDGRLPAPFWFGALRAYGYLIAAEKPA